MIIPKLFYNESYLFFINYQYIWILTSLFYLYIIFETDITINNKSLVNKLKKYWNILFSIFSAFGTYFIGSYTIYLIKNYGLISIIDHREKIYDYRENLIIGWWSRTFIISKVVELFDTILLKLSGKNPIFLQWYHHIVTMYYAYYLGINYDYSHIGLLLSLMNFFIHTLMYFYFFIHPYLSHDHIIKKYSYVLTFLQACQMFIALYSYLYLYLYLDYPFDYFGFSMYSIYGLLFLKLFLKKIKNS